jgi:hypothetical protein
MDSSPPTEPEMRVYRDRVWLRLADGRELTFLQGPMSRAAQDRYARIDAALRGGWLDKTVGPAMSPDTATALSPEWVAIFEKMADSITANYGRAMAAIAVIQLAIKAIEPDQSIRLTKGEPPRKSTHPEGTKEKAGGDADDFSWVEGLSMRGLSSRYFVPFLRNYGLVFGNKYGPFMTRAYSENYPYSPMYKAVLRGPRKEWDRIVEGLEDGSLNPKGGFVLLCSLLANRSTAFERTAHETMLAAGHYLSTKPGLSQVKKLIRSHIHSSMNSARLLEIAAHSLLQALYPLKFGAAYQVRTLSQMRSANLKAGNVGDVELLEPTSGKVLEAWDAKAGKITIDVELGELKDKLARNRGVVRSGFILDSPVKLAPTSAVHIADIRKATGTDVAVLSLEDWVDSQLTRASDSSDEIAVEWLRAYAESLCQMRRDRAPIDEPSGPWVEGLRKEIESAAK